MMLTMDLLHAPQTARTQQPCYIPCPYPCPIQPPPVVPTTTPGIPKETTKPPPPTSPPPPPTTTTTTKETTITTTSARPSYSDWTPWSCTESCGGCGIGRRTRKCLLAPIACQNAVVEYNNETCNQQPCPFGKSTCCGQFRLGQINKQFACVS